MHELKNQIIEFAIAEPVSFTVLFSFAIVGLCVISAAILDPYLNKNNE